MVKVMVKVMDPCYTGMVDVYRPSYVRCSTSSILNFVIKSTIPSPAEREVFIDNLLVRIHLIIVMIR